MTTNWMIVDPETEDRMTHIGHFYTPCDVLRDIYSMTDDPEIRIRLRICTSMCKSMAARITKYDGKRWGQKVFPKNPRFKEPIKEVKETKVG